VRNVRSVRKRERKSKSRKTFYADAAFPKSPPKRDPKFRAWVAQQKCLVERWTGDRCVWKVHAAHVSNGTGGMGMKGDDLLVPLCFHHHIDEQHGRGVKWFEAKYGVILTELALEYRDEYEEAR
jgi:hypothetical protein